MQKQFSMHGLLILSFLFLFNVCSSQEKINEKLKVYFFIATSCPISQQYTNEITRLQKKYAKNGVEINLVFPNDGKKSINKKIKEFYATYALTSKCINDRKFKLTKKYNATVTPEAFLVAANGTILYHGAIDNWYYQLGKNRIEITAHYLEDAILEALQEKTISIPYTDPIGCFIEVAK